MFRYVAFIWDSASQACSARVQQWENSLRAAGCWSSALSVGGLQVWTAGATAHFRPRLLAGTAGSVVGEVFARVRNLECDAAAQAPAFDETSSREILSSRGRRLITHYWGNYVAMLRDARSSTVRVIKDPAGSLPCHTVRSEGVQVVFSDLSDALALSVIQLRVNWDFVRSRLVHGVFEQEEEPWAGVSTVRRGECVAIGPHERVDRESLWHPARFEDADQVIDDPARAGRALLATVRSCTHALATPHQRVLQQTSGGLDSSIVLSVLAAAPHQPDVTCYTLYIDGAPSDERRWARLAASASGCRHREVPFDFTAVDLARLAPLRPSVYPASAAIEWQRAAVGRGLCADTHASAVFTGEGGDASFCATSYVLAVDHMLDRVGLSRQLWNTALLVAARRDRTVWEVLRDAIRRRLVGSSMRDYRRLMSHRGQLLRDDARIDSPRFPNPWFSADAGLDLESIWRLGTLAFAPQFYNLAVASDDPGPLTVSPLCAQPVYELCRRIPVDLHFEDGRIRGLARRTFAGRVPDAILRRQWKDRPMSHPAQIVEQNRGFIRDLLLDGALIGEHILDRPALEDVLSGELGSQRALAGEILEHVDLELWIRNSTWR